jgi:hypothetical protein
MLAPATGLARTYRQLGKPPGPMPSFAEQQLRNLTPGAVDYCADDLDGYADGDTVGTWPARRGGLDLSTVAGTPAYTAPDQTLRVPSVAYAASGERHEGPAIDWSASKTATLLSVWYSSLTLPAIGGIGGLHADLNGYPSTDGGVEHLLGANSGYWTPLHRPDGALNYWLERDTDADLDALHVTVSVHDTASATSADEIRGYQDGVEIVGTGTGSSGSGANWQAALYPAVGARGPAANEGLDGRLVRFIAMPSALTDAQALRASRCLLYTART